VIYGIGTDIVAVPRLQVNLDRYGERFAARILTASEMAVFRETANKAHFLAKRFAAKEALVKALGTGFRDGLSLRDIAVANDTIQNFLLHNQRDGTFEESGLYAGVAFASDSFSC